MAVAKARVKVPKTVAQGEVFEVKSLISHKMETGLRKDKAGELIPRMIINSFVCKYNGERVFACDWSTPISANPFTSFYLTAAKSGTLDFIWTDDDGNVFEKSADVTVT